MFDFRKLALAAGLATVLAAGLGVTAQAQGVPESEGLSALSPENLAKKRPKPPFDLTGAWQQDLKERNGVRQTFQFGTPYPKFKEAGQKAQIESKAASAAGKAYRDDIGHCYPAGMPMIMTRVWPVGMIQMPTAIFMVHAFMNSYRAVFLDGRKHTDLDILPNTYNGESIGTWEGNTLVIDTIGFETSHHWIDNGIPVSEQFHMVEKVKMVDKNTLEWTYIMTDPENWEGDWISTKYFTRRNMDIPEVECTPDLNQHITATQANQVR
ncbi:MAG: hypothetical protein ABIO39_13765 [Caulobacteraceae bacterium]